MNTLFSSLFLMKLTPKWYETFQKIEELENVLPNPKTLKPLRTIKRILFIIVTSALGEITYSLLLYVGLTIQTRWHRCRNIVEWHKHARFKKNSFLCALSEYFLYLFSHCCNLFIYPNCRIYICKVKNLFFQLNLQCIWYTRRMNQSKG